jgi:putative ABC transport system substrate-binding protein
MAMAPELILACGTPAAVALQQMSRTIPTVFADVFDPLANGLVTCLAHPGGNITGFAGYEHSLAAKLMELLKQIAPRTTRVAFVYDPSNPNWPGYLAVLQAEAPSLGMQVSEAPLQEVADIERVIDAFAHEPDGGLIVKGSAFPNLHREQLINHAALRRLPAVYEYRHYVTDGGLTSYGTDPNESY